VKNLRFHHVGALVTSIDAALPLYMQLHPNGQPSEKIFIASQNVNVCFVAIGNGTFIELIEETTNPSAVSNLVKRGVTFYHLGYKSDNFDESIASLEAQGYTVFDVIHSEAYNGKRVRFCLSPQQHWIEVIEA
jgi:methylmalonyl-CoA/ethylmalonyl-CoA epimerase